MKPSDQRKKSSKTILNKTSSMDKQPKLLDIIEKTIPRKTPLSDIIEKPTSRKIRSGDAVPRKTRTTDTIQKSSDIIDKPIKKPMIVPSPKSKKKKIVVIPDFNLSNILFQRYKTPRIIRDK